MPKHEADTIEKPEVKQDDLEIAGYVPVSRPFLEYDAPPPQFVPGTVVPKDTDPADMTDAEYAQWCFENLMPYWAIRKEMYLRKPPVLSGLEPSSATIGDPSFDIHVSGEGFLQDSIIVFAGYDEPTTLNDDGTLSTGVNMGVWHGPDTLEVRVRNGAMVSEPLMFTFNGAAPEAEPEDDEEDDGEADETGKKKRRSRHKK